MEHIEILYANEDDAMFGADPDATIGVDIPASCDKYESMLVAALEKFYPEAKYIDVRPGGGDIRVDGDTASDDAIEVGYIVQRVWESFDWIVAE